MTSVHNKDDTIPLSTQTSPPPTVQRGTSDYILHPTFPDIAGGLKTQNAHPRDNRIQFFEEGHTYNVDGKTNFLSTTTMVKEYCCEFDADKIIGNIAKRNGEIPAVHDPSLHVIATGKYAGKTRSQIAEMWKESGERASSLGTVLHGCIEFYYNGWTDQFPYLTPPEFTSQFQSFQKNVVEAEGLVPYRTEWFVFDEDHELAGSIDMTYQMDPRDPDRLVIYDWKRSCKLSQKTNRYQNMRPPLDHLPDTNYHHYAMQLNIYRYVLETKYGKRIEGMYLVGIHPDLNGYQREPVPRLEVETEAIFAQRREQLKLRNDS